MGRGVTLTTTIAISIVISIAIVIAIIIIINSSSCSPVLILHTKHTGGCRNDFAASGHSNRNDSEKFEAKGRGLAWVDARTSVIPPYSSV
jgi:hypothetical protein